MERRRIHDVILLLGIGMIFLGAGFEFIGPHSLTPGTCFGVGGTLFAIYEILRIRLRSKYS